MKYTLSFHKSQPDWLTLVDEGNLVKIDFQRGNFELTKTVDVAPESPLKQQRNADELINNVVAAMSEWLLSSQCFHALTPSRYQYLENEAGDIRIEGGKYGDIRLYIKDCPLRLATNPHKLGSELIAIGKWLRKSGVKIDVTKPAETD